MDKKFKNMTRCDYIAWMALTRLGHRAWPKDRTERNIHKLTMGNKSNNCNYNNQRQLPSH